MTEQSQSATHKTITGITEKVAFLRENRGCQEGCAILSSEILPAVKMMSTFRHGCHLGYLTEQACVRTRLRREQVRNTESQETVTDPCFLPGLQPHSPPGLAPAILALKPLFSL